MIVYINIDNLHAHLIFVIGGVARGTSALADLETLQRLKSLCAAGESLRTWDTQTYKKPWENHGKMGIYVENHHFLIGKSTISMGHFQ